MKYFFFSLEGESFWLEAEKDIVLRQIIQQADGHFLVSCRDDCLSESSLEEEDLDLLQVISAEVFEAVWKDAIAPFSSIWKQEKENYPIGTELTGKLLYFYPQGVIFSVGKIQGCANEESYFQTIESAHRYPGNSIHGIVSEYDEQNMWIKIICCPENQTCHF